MGGSLAVGMMSLSSASPSSSFVVNQGAPGSSPWPVHDSGTVSVAQSGAWNVGVNFPATQPVTGTVGIDPNHNAVSVNNFPATQNVSGTVHVASPTAISGQIGCAPANGDRFCANPGEPAPFVEGDVINTLSVSCTSVVGHKVYVDFFTNNVFIFVPLTLAGTYGGNDVFTGTVTGIGLHLDGLSDAYMQAQWDYATSTGDGSFCFMNYTGSHAS